MVRLPCQQATYLKCLTRWVSMCMSWCSHISARVGRGTLILSNVCTIYTIRFTMWLMLYFDTRAYVYIYAGAFREALILIVYSAFGRVYRSIFYHLFVQIDDILLCQLAANRSSYSMNKRNERGKNKEDINLFIAKISCNQTLKYSC